MIENLLYVTFVEEIQKQNKINMSAPTGILKSSIVKKYWMAATGLFLCLFLVGHLAGNFQLFVTGYAGKLQFNEYTVFMTTNPAVKILSYVTYLSILFHVIDGIVLSVRNRKARPVQYAYNKPSANSMWSSRNMGILGTIILAYIVFHMGDFWYEYKFGSLPYMATEAGDGFLLKDGTEVMNATINEAGKVVSASGEIMGPAMKDLHEEVIEAFRVPWIVGLYVVGMIAIGFHLWHGFSSAFQSLGVNHPKYTPVIKKLGYGFAVLIPLGFAIIPIYLFVTL